jgi:hypothetical protein
MMQNKNPYTKETDPPDGIMRPIEPAKEIHVLDEEKETE